MASVKVKDNPSSRVTAGNDLLARAGKVTAKAVTAKLAAFKKIHAGYVSAEKASNAAAETEATALRAIAVTDVAQDSAVEGLPPLASVPADPARTRSRPSASSRPARSRRWATHTKPNA